MTPALPLLLAAFALPQAAPAAPADVDAAIRRVMDDSARAWTAGDLAGFMTSYEDGPGTVFVTSKGPLTGYGAIADMYRAHYGGAGGSLGALSFDGLSVRPLGPDYAVAYGRFHLVRKDRPAEDTGVFDLIFHHGPQGWRIVSDHTS